MKRYALVIAYQDTLGLAFEHRFTMSLTNERAYFSPEMRQMEDDLLSQGFRLCNNYAFEIPEVTL